MNKINIYDNPAVPKDILNQIKAELSLEGKIKYGVTNPYNRLPYFIETKQGTNLNWGYCEIKKNNAHHFVVAGSPLDNIIMIDKIGGMFIGHSANFEIGFSAVKVTSDEDGQDVMKTWRITYLPFGQSDNESASQMHSREYAICLHGQGGAKKDYITDAMCSIHKSLPNPFLHMQGYQIIDFFLTIVYDLAVASPTAANYIQEKLPILKRK